MEQIVINHWLPYIWQYLKINKLKATRENIEAAFEHHKNTIFQDTGLNLKTLPSMDDLALFQEIIAREPIPLSIKEVIQDWDTVYCSICGCGVGKVLQGADRINIICIDCAEKEDKKREPTMAVTT